MRRKVLESLALYVQVAQYALNRFASLSAYRQVTQCLINLSLTSRNHTAGHGDVFKGVTQHRILLDSHLMAERNQLSLAVT